MVSTLDSWVLIEQHVDAFEEELALGRHPDLADFAPDEDHALYREVLVELVRVDLECHWRRGETRALEDYRDRFPALFDDPESLGQLAYEEYRLRLQSGQFQGSGEDSQSAGGDDTRRVFVGEHQFPQPGDMFAGFHLVTELGRGALGRAFLARQETLADRLVVLKISSETFRESQVLAQLQHTNIVPIHSVHHRAPFTGICMPFLGSATLADVVSTLRKHDASARTGNLLFTAAHGAEALQGLAAAAAQASRGSYVNAVLWIARQVAEGLAHAHERGIVHHDLKPANVLLADDGTPLLLDFNLASNPRSAAFAIVGGTVPYMSPEQLRSLGTESAESIEDASEAAPERDTPRAASAASDVFSLGALLHELLTGRLPFAKRSGPDELARALADRRQPLARPSSLNGQVPSSVDAIVTKALAFEPERRYASMRDMVEDLDRQLTDRPLRFAPDRSPVQRLRKWIRRNPRGPSLLVAILAVLATGAAVLGLAVQRNRALPLEARKQRDDFHSQATPALYHLYHAVSADPHHLERGIDLGAAALRPLGVFDNPHWDANSFARLLDDDHGARLRAEVGELVAAMAQASDIRFERGHQNEDDRQIAEQCRRYLSGLEASEAERLRDHPFSRGRRHVIAGDYGIALEELRRAVRQDPDSFWAWFLIGRCYDEAGQFREAIAAYDVCVSLWPEFAMAYFNRGVAKLRADRHGDALEDFDDCLRREPDVVHAWINRGICNLETKQPARAVDDFSHALLLQPNASRVLLMRSRAHAACGQPDEAARDRDAGLAAEPDDPAGWVARGYAQLANRDLALADFEKALDIDPHYVPALQNKAALLAGTLEDTPAAIALLDQLIGRQPGFVPAIAGRGVLLARLGKSEEALRDAEAALSLNRSPAVQYQVAGIYAQLCRSEPDHRHEALRLLRAALARGYGWELFEQDSDLDPLRSEPPFAQTIDAARRADRARSQPGVDANPERRHNREVDADGETPGTKRTEH